MKIWYIHNYTMLPEHGALNRGYYLGKYLKKNGQEPIVFVGSHPHNTKLQLINDSQKYRVYNNEPFPWVLIKIRNYEGSKISRVLSMVEFYFNMKEAAKHFERPDVIIGSSAHPLAALLAIKLAKRFGCKGIVEVRDLWPESIVNYGLAKPNNPLIKLLYSLEKYLYVHADSIIFTMENAWLYFVEKGLDKIIPQSKVYYLNNGVDLEEFNRNVVENKYEDEDLTNNNVFKIVYAGAIRRVNSIGTLLDVAKKVKNDKIRFLIWGDGDELTELRSRVEKENISNVKFKGYAEKRYVPYITSHADLNLIHGKSTPILKYGLSANKLFDYAAAGKPILSDFNCGHNPAELYNAGFSIANASVEAVAELIDDISLLPKDKYSSYCANALRLAEDYSYDRLAQKLIGIISEE